MLAHSVRNLSRLCGLKRRNSQNSKMAGIQTDSETLFKCSDCASVFRSMEGIIQHNCYNRPNIPVPVSAEQGDGNTGTNMATTWNRAQTLMLIELYKSFEPEVSSGRMRKKAMWEKISKQMEERGYQFSADQISGRWKSLIRAYKNVKDHNGKSGNSNKTFDYETQLDELFENDPTMTPKFVLSSGSSGNQSVTQSATQSGESLTDDSDGLESPPSKKLKKKTNAKTELVDLSKGYIEEQKEDWKKRDQMHKEKLTVMSSLVDVLKDMKNSGKNN